ncbi:MAG TPA: MBL fold metallo-hydrolase RNA specificity domain-containing protein, partial [Candidatus Hydrogenedentes bacterium]|nr:MBL fold metallo-hydrolase RNA specificity domain-containing protein [Candidatus Hydrogenedentota bacterium]
LHHLKNNCEDPRNIILIVGFQAKNTLGRRIVERQPRIKIFGVEHPLNAEVRIMNGFSAHAGRSELLAFGKHFQRVRLVHGEQTALAALRTGLAEAGIPDVAILREAEPIEA